MAPAIDPFLFFFVIKLDPFPTKNRVKLKKQPTDLGRSHLNDLAFVGVRTWVLSAGEKLRDRDWEDSISEGEGQLGLEIGFWGLEGGFGLPEDA